MVSRYAHSFIIVIQISDALKKQTHSGSKIKARKCQCTTLPSLHHVPSNIKPSHGDNHFAYATQAAFCPTTIDPREIVKEETN